MTTRVYTDAEIEREANAYGEGWLIYDILRSLLAERQATQPDIDALVIAYSLGRADEKEAQTK